VTTAEPETGRECPMILTVDDACGKPAPGSCRFCSYDEVQAISSEADAMALNTPLTLWLKKLTS
jgi:hypothetical protein